MPTYQIPDKNKKLVQVNRGDSLGNLWATFNMDFDSSLGRIKVAPRLRINTDSVDDTDLTTPTAFLRTSASNTDQYWALCGTVLFKTAGTNPTAGFTQDAIASSPTTLSYVCSDMVEFEGALVVSDTTDLNRLAAGTWDNAWWLSTLAQTALVSGIAHPLHVSLKSNLLLVGDGNNMHIIDKNNNVRIARVILPNDFEITWIRSNYEGTWIGARNKFGREGKVFFWDEYAENYNRAYVVKSDIAFSGVMKDGVLFIINGEGQLLQFNGAGFTEKAVLPIFGQANKRWDDGTAPRSLVHRNGMTVIEEKIHVLCYSRINDDSTKFMENFPSGIYVFDEERGLTHKYALTLYDGSEIDYGAMSTITLPGAIVATTKSQGLLLAGGTIPSDSTTFLHAIFYRDVDDSINKRGHFITAVMESSAFEDVFQDLLASFKRLKNSGDKIVIKYRSIKNPNLPIEGTGTWQSTSTFSTTQVLTNASAGDEAMIIRGKGSGATAKISSITEAGGTYTVTLAEAITGVAGTLRFLIGDWTECATISTQSIERQAFDLDVVGTWIQLKVELRSAPAGTALAGDSPELEKIQINSKGEFIT